MGLDNKQAYLFNLQIVREITLVDTKTSRKKMKNLIAHILEIIGFAKNNKNVVRDILENYVFRKIPRKPKKWNSGKKGNVVLVHGFGGNWSYLKEIGNFVNKLGYRVHVLNELGVNLKPIFESYKILEKYIDNNNLKNLILIGHSKGGIISKYFIDNSPLTDRVKLIISIASPFGGTQLGRLKILNTHEFLPDSAIIQKLNAKTSKNKLFINLFSRKDDVVIPNQNLILKGAKNIKVEVDGHLGILESEKTLREIDKILS